MHFIKSLLHIFNPDITIRRIQTSEETEKGTISHEFVCFDAKGVCVSNVFSAKILAKKMGKKVFPFLNNLVETTKDKEKSAKILKTKAWVFKKAVWHPMLVEKCAQKVLQKMKNSAQINEIPLPYKEIYKDVCIIAVLHDIGRLSEVDIAQGTVVMKGSGLNKNHAAISYDILENALIKPEILLAIKYHEFADIKEAVQDEVYEKLPADNKKISEFYIRILQDMDKTANLLERSKFGIKKCAEFHDSCYIQDYDLTEEYFEQAMCGNYLNLKGGHLLDAMMRFVTWTYSIHFVQTKELLSSVLTNFFWQMYLEAKREYDASKTKNAQKLADTLEKITQLEDYAIVQRMNMAVNLANRYKINKQIAALRKN